MENGHFAVRNGAGTLDRAGDAWRWWRSSGWS